MNFKSMRKKIYFFLALIIGASIFAHKVQAQVYAQNDTLLMTIPGTFSYVTHNDSLDASGGMLGYTTTISWHNAPELLGITFAPPIERDGILAISPDALPGVYTFDYEVSVQDASMNWHSDTATVVVTLYYDTTMITHDDTIYLESLGPWVLNDFLHNDTIHGVPGADVEFDEWVDSGVYRFSGTLYTQGIYSDDGKANSEMLWASECVPDGTIMTGEYRVMYVTGTPYVAFNSAYSAKSTITLIISSNMNPIDDDYFVMEPNQTSISIFANDSISLVDTLTPTDDYVYSTYGPIPDGIILNEDGTVSTSADILPGIYTFQYELERDCDPDPVEPPPYTRFERVLTDVDGWIATVTIEVQAPMNASLLSFDASKEGNMAQIRWATTSSAAFTAFEVQRSQDGLQWQTIGEQDATQNNAATVSNYEWLDQKPNAGANFYRLKMKEQSGTYSYSKTARLDMDQIHTINIYPNPAHNTISIGGLHGGELLHVYDFTGRLVLQQRAQTQKETLSLEGIGAGVYQLQIIDGAGKASSHKFVISK